MQPFLHLTRIAPTPSGFLHLGNVLSFALTAALAKEKQAGIVLRIDDLDRERLEAQYVQDIFDTLTFLNIPWHYGPHNYTEYETTFSQVKRLERYNAALEQLRPYVFACNCSRAQIRLLSPNGEYPGTCKDKHIDLDAENVSWRLKTGDQQIIVHTTTGAVEATLPADMQSFVIRKRNGYPAYHLSSVIDDQYFGTDLIVRGQDLWHSTLAQVYLSKLLPDNNFAESTFYHHGLLMESGDIKMSKSAGATSVQYLRKQGKSAAEIYSMIEPGAENWEQLAALYHKKAAVPK